MSPVAQTASNEHIELINDLMERGEKNPFLVKRAVMCAKSLLKSDAVQSYVLQGIIASYEDKSFEEVAALFDKALKLSPHDWLANINYAVAALKYSAYDEAFETAAKALASAVDAASQRESLETYSHACLFSLRFNEFEKIDRGISGVTKFMSDHGISDDNLKEFVLAVQNVNREAKISIDLPTINIFEEEGMLAVLFPVKAGAMKVFEMSQALVEELLKKDLSSKVTSLITVDYICA